MVAGFLETESLLSGIQNERETLLGHTQSDPKNSEPGQLQCERSMPSGEFRPVSPGLSACPHYSCLPVK